MRINKSESKVSKGKEEWLTIRYFNTTGECIKALREQNIEIWVTDLSLGAQSLEDTSITVPNRVAIVMGQEAEGASEEILAAADKKIYLPIYGFGESLNLSVATALVLQKVLYMCPEARGQMPEEERQELREKWYTRLARDDVNKQRDYKLWLQNPPLPVNDLRREEQFRIEFIPGKIRKRSERERNANNITNEEKSDNTDQV
jgi:tRNA(Leu) C34 or U34 (ribose-2'-O)-methylase TrmL